MNNKTLLVVVGALFVGILAIYFGKDLLDGKKSEDVLIDRTATEVIRRLQANYTPGPYAPGFDPDKVDPRAFRQTGPPARLTSAEVSPTPVRYNNWSDAWEAQRK